MAEDIFSTFSISGQGMSVQRQRLSAVAKNIANAISTNGPDGKSYQREIIEVKATPQNDFNTNLNQQISLMKTDPQHAAAAKLSGNKKDEQILETSSVKDNTAPRLVYDPSHPDANDDGYVEMPNVNVVTEMVEMITAQRAFEANAGVVESVKNIARYSLDI
jgi:flagellar basal-body rod protein FlgC